MDPNHNREVADLVCAAAAADRSLDLGGVLFFEHINLIVGERQVAEVFYFDLLGLTRQKGASFHCNLGQQQFHLQVQ
jgi:hypothetical protein